MPEIGHKPVFSKNTLAPCQETKHYMPWKTWAFSQEMEHAHKMHHSLHELVTAHHEINAHGLGKCDESGGM